MKTRHSLSALLLAATCFSLPAMAQSGNPPPLSTPAAAQMATDSGKGHGMGHDRHGRKGMRDCSQSKNPAECKARQDAMKANIGKAKEACKDKTAQERPVCMREQMLALMDCAQAPHPERCEAHKKAITECKTQTGPEFKTCMRNKMPPPDCSKAQNPERCKKMQAVRETCKNKGQGERRNCMQEQMKAQSVQ